MRDNQKGTVPVMGNFKWGARPEYRRCTAPPGCNETAVCRRSERCIGCPFPATGFICWGNDDDCMKTRIEKFKEIEKRDHTDDGTP